LAQKEEVAAAVFVLPFGVDLTTTILSTLEDKL
jgi:hypothetical protein